MEVDYATVLDFKRPGTPLYVLWRMGLVELDDSAEPHRVDGTDLLRSVFAEFRPDALPEVIAALRDRVVAYALDRSGFLSGSTLNIPAVDRLRVLGATDSGQGLIWSLITKAADEIARDRARARTMHR